MAEKKLPEAAEDKMNLDGPVRYFLTLMDLLIVLTYK
jgi:hypothetical protein